MDNETSPHIGRTDGTLIEPDPGTRAAIMRRWWLVESGMGGERGEVPRQPDDAVAFQLVEAAETSIGRGDSRRAAHILRLVARDYPQSQEAALARRVIDWMADQPAGPSR